MMKSKIICFVAFIAVGTVFFVPLIFFDAPKLVCFIVGMVYMAVALCGDFILEIRLSGKCPICERSKTQSPARPCCS